MRKVVLFFLLFVASLGATLTIESQNREGEWGKVNSRYLLRGDSISLRVSIPEDSIQRIEWYQIIPDVSQYYKNANHPHEPNPYKWVGFGEIAYNRIKIEPFKNQQKVQVTPQLLKRNTPIATAYYHYYLGSFWFQVEVTLMNGTKITSAGVEKNDHRGLSPRILRLSYLESYDFMGYLTSYLNVPGIFGSVPYQCKNYIGVDCADVIMAARSIEKTLPFKDYNVAMMVRKFKHRATLTLDYGSPSKELTWGKDLDVGDFIAVKYSPKSQYAHIGVLYKDANSNGFLDSEDIVLHAGPDALHGSRLSDRGFDGEIVILKNE